MIKLLLDAKDEKTARHLLSGIAHRMEHAKPAFLLIQSDLFDRQAKWWRTRGGRTWPLLHKATVARKRREHEDSRPLVRGGDLLAAATRPHSGGEQRLDITDDRVMLGLTPLYTIFLARDQGRNPLASQSRYYARQYAKRLEHFILVGGA